MTECPSGKLSKTHLQRLFKRVFPVGDSENFCDYIFRLFDDDGNNVLEFKEFLQVSSIYFLRFSIGILEETLFVKEEVLYIPNGCLDAYEVKGNIDIFKYQEKVKPISQFQRFLSFFKGLLEFASLPNEIIVKIL